ncbi:conserved exported hypothetical protein [Candidatus Terasakiella magnetica]|nr:conserved exported hypothetical protein [Candidatus Terasakiella magnetica]
MLEISRRSVLAGLLAAFPAGKALAALDCRTARPVALGETRRIFLDEAEPAALWADVARPQDLDAMRSLVRAVMADVHRKPSWSAGWNIATKFAYHAIYKPFGFYMAESDHFAALLGSEPVAKSDMAGLQRLYTLAHAGCSTVMAWDETHQRMLHFRSLDWPSAGAIAQATRLYAGTRKDGAVAFSAAGILGMVGILTAVKPGFSVAINFAPWTGTSFSLNADPTFLIRQLMASAVTSYHDAHRVIAAWNPGAPVFISLCGIAKGEAAIFEFGAAWDDHGPCHAIALGEGDFMIQTNHFDPSGPFARHNRPQAAASPWGDPAWDAHTILETSVARKALIREALGTAYGGNRGFDLEAVLRAVFIRRPIWNCETAQWVAMIPASGEMRAWVRSEA